MHPVLDDPAAIAALDGSDMLGLTGDYPAQFRAGRRIGEAVDLPPGRDHAAVVVLGTGGGSAAGAHLVRAYTEERLAAPLIVQQGYDLPAWVGPRTPVFAVSHSGTTEEIVSAARIAAARGAPLVGLGAGGPLRDVVIDAGGGYGEIPGGFMPRIGIGYISMALLTVLERMGLVRSEGLDDELDHAFALLGELVRRYGPDEPTERNRAKVLAVGMAGRIPVVYGSLTGYEAVADRIKRQLGENAKLMAFTNSIPALHHDEAVGWDMDPSLCARLAFLLLRDERSESPQMRKRWSATAEILGERMGHVEEAWAEGEGRLARLLSLVTLGDFYSIYAAIAAGIDPTPVAIIDLFKRRVASGS